MNFAVFRYSAQ